MNSVPLSMTDRILQNIQRLPQRQQSPSHSLESRIFRSFPSTFRRTWVNFYSFTTTTDKNQAPFSWTVYGYDDSQEHWVPLNRQESVQFSTQPETRYFSLLQNHQLFNTYRFSICIFTHLFSIGISIDRGEQWISIGRNPTLFDSECEYLHSLLSKVCVLLPCQYNDFYPSYWSS